MRPLPSPTTNGWPSTFAEMVPLAHRLADLGHDVVVPSLPGFTFSDQQATAPGEIPTSELWHRLMIGHRIARHFSVSGEGHERAPQTSTVLPVKLLEPALCRHQRILHHTPTGRDSGSKV